MTSIPTFAIRPTFLGLEGAGVDATICVTGIPFDLGTSNRPSAAAPRRHALRRQ